ncbi:Eco57I restriction-modification methylase domain-containing protein [Apilactobacillus zhangqiuensis]|uniref:Eco57I restriction-modification methylase domain-containing protein n=1 Tax=Apilactobacillus zhangqiuensis TaxID=2841031 RepID=UPI001C7D0210|nr:Eco57I restriction-modification methylase domain-containing protein [Apilactobacillus zhangqiuensis]
MNKSTIKKIIKDNDLTDVDSLLFFLEEQINNYSLDDLREIAELSNENRNNNSAFYTNRFIVDEMINDIPIVDSDEISVLEPSSGIGNFVIPFIEKISRHYKKVRVDINDIDSDSLRVLKFFVDKSAIPSNVYINYYNYDFLSGMAFINKKYDYLIGNPPFQRVSNKVATENGYPGVTNLSGQFLIKSLQISKYVSLIMPKNLLSTMDFELVRKLLSTKKINSIVDFGEKGFKGVLIETIGILVNSLDSPHFTKVKSIVNGEEKCHNQKYIMDEKFPNWLIYRNSDFDNIAQKMEFDYFKVFRDRQITNKILSDQGTIRVIRSRNISRDGSRILDIDGYDKFLKDVNVEKLSVYKYLKDDKVYLSPNMTYYPRIIRKDREFLVNGSVAILIPKNGILLQKKQVDFINSNEFREFYNVARNRGTRSLNIDNTSVFWFGKYIGDDSK